MFRRFRENLIDEVVAMNLLHSVFRYRNHPPICGTAAASFPALYSGDRDALLRPLPVPQCLEKSAPPEQFSSTLAVEDVCFRSPVQTAFPETNRVVCRRWFNPQCETGRVIVGVDGIVQFGMRWFHAFAREIVPHGWDLYMLDAPFNHRRTPAGYRPGQLILGGDVEHQLAVSRQAILDLWTLVATLQSCGRQVGLLGVSYGGWMVTNVAQLADDLLFLHALTPPLEMAALLTEGSSLIRALRRGLGDEHRDRKELERIARPISPWYYRPRLDRSRIFVHAARYDRFVPTPRILSYAETLGVDPIVYPRGHITATCGFAVLRETAARIRDLT